MPEYRSIWDRYEPKEHKDRSILDFPLKSRYLEDNNK
jgi:hypothetical protein